MRTSLPERSLLTESVASDFEGFVMAPKAVSVAVVFVLGCWAVGPAEATPQIPCTLRYGGRVYTIPEIPMLGLWDSREPPAPGGQRLPPFEVRSTANWAGYRAVFEIRDGKLLLRRVVGRIAGQKRVNEEIISGASFPLLATWYSGRIHLAVGDPDLQRNESTAVLIFEVERGRVRDVTFAKRLSLPGTWNGLEPSAVDAAHPEDE